MSQDGHTARWVIVGAMALAGMFGAGVGSAATVSVSDGTIVVTTTAPDQVIVGKAFVASVQVQNVSAAPIGTASATLQYLRDAMKVKSLATPTAGAVCEKATTRGTIGYAACGNITLQPGASIVTNVTLEATAAGQLSLGSYGYTASGPFTQGTLTWTPQLPVYSTK